MRPDERVLTDVLIGDEVMTVQPAKDDEKMTSDDYAVLATTTGPEVYERSIAALRRDGDAGLLTARALVEAYLARIAALDQGGPRLRSIIELNPDALATAEALDAERQAQGPRGPLHGIPILIKDNIDTADAMHTTAGSLALLGSRPEQDATVAARLRAAGAILLGKANLSEWANFRSTHSTSGWSGRGGLTRNPHMLDRSAGGSSSGSAAAVAASFAAAALGTETDGSVICPSALCGIVGIKPTVGLTSRAGVIPIAHSQDTVGIHARSVADAALILGIIAGPDPRDLATAASADHVQADYTRFLDADGLRGARIGVARQKFTGYHPGLDAAFEQAIAVMRDHGATIIDPADIPTIGDAAMRTAELEVLQYELKADINTYLATRIPDERYPDRPLMRTLADLIAFNMAHAEAEMPYFGQEQFEAAQAKGDLTTDDYREARATCLRLARDEGLDVVFTEHRLDALVAPSYPPAWTIDLVNGDRASSGVAGPAALAGYPLLTLPIGMLHSLPVGLTFMGRAFTEPMLIRLASALEHAIDARRPPLFRRSLLD